MQVRQNQQYFQHAVALLRFGFSGFFVQVLHNRQRIREHLFYARGIDEALIPGLFERLVGSRENLVEVVLQTKTLGSQAAGNYIFAVSFATSSGDGPFITTSAPD